MEGRLLAPELLGYLEALAARLEEAGAAAAAEQVRRVRKFGSGSTSELYAEARLLLPTMLNGAMLSQADRERLQEVIAGIDREFAFINKR